MDEGPAWRGVLAEADRLDVAVYAAIAATPTPRLDRAMAALSRAADHSKISLSAAGLLALGGGPDGLRAARSGLACVAVTSAIVNLVLKRAGRRRPDPAAANVPLDRRVRMPRSTSFPSGHAAAAFAFATGAGRVLPRQAAPLHGLAALIAYSRIHTGVHYPADAVAGAVAGTAIAQVIAKALDR